MGVDYLDDEEQELRRREHARIMAHADVDVQALRDRMVRGAPSPTPWFGDVVRNRARAKAALQAQAEGKAQKPVEAPHPARVLRPIKDEVWQRQARG